MVPFSMALNDPNPDFKVTPLFDAGCLRNGTTYRHSFNEILIGTYTRLKFTYHLKSFYFNAAFN